MEIITIYGGISMKNERLSFRNWLEENYGISYEYFDNNYSGQQADEVWEAYNEYTEKGDEDEGF